MWEQFSVKIRGIRLRLCRKFMSALLSATLAIGIAVLAPVAAHAQATLPAIQPSAGMPPTSPLASGSTRPEGIPLGSTEITTPGIAPVSPAQGIGSCAGSANAGSPGAPFDGGGLSGGTPLSCADRQIPPTTLPSPSSVGRVGIPLGATELGGAGLSPAVPAPSPNLSGNAGSANSPGTP